MNYYTSIDELPLYSWRKINETNDLKWMFKSGKGQVNKKIVEAWGKLFDEFIDAFGISDQFLQILEKKKQIAILTAEMYLYNDRSRETFIDIEKWELSKLLEDEGKGSSFHETKAHIEKEMGFQINERTTSVLDYYTYLNLLKEKPQAANKK
jgi:hypothetical protein